MPGIRVRAEEIIGRRLAGGGCRTALRFCRPCTHARSSTINGLRPAVSGLLLILSVFLLLSLSCGGGRAVRQDRTGQLDRELRSVARTIAGELPAGSRVVVLNLEPFGGGRQFTMLGVYLAQRLSGELRAAAGTNITVIDRQAGEKAWLEEMRYSIELTEPAELLQGFGADVALVGDYRLRPDEHTLELISIKAIQTGRADVTVCSHRHIRTGPGEYADWVNLEKQIPRGVTEKMVEFLSKHGEMDAIESIRLRTADGREVRENQDIRVGEQMKLEVGISRECNIMVIGWDHTNEIFTVLHPHEGDSPEFGAGQFVLPRGTATYRALPPPGYNWLRVIATTEDIRYRGVPPGFVVDQATQNSIVDRILALGPRNWGSRSFAVNIVER